MSFYFDDDNDDNALSQVFQTSSQKQVTFSQSSSTVLLSQTPRNQSLSQQLGSPSQPFSQNSILSSISNASKKSDNNAQNAFVCQNCGAIDQYYQEHGLVTCSKCFTQSQNFGALQEELDYDETQHMAARNRDGSLRRVNTKTQRARNPDGGMVQIPKRNFAEDMMFVAGPGKFLKAGGGGLGLIRQMGKYPKFPKGYTSGKGDKFVEETAPFLSNQYFKNLIRPYTSGMKELTKEAAGTVKDYGLPFGIGSLGASFGLKKGYDAFMGDEDPDLKTEEQK